MTADLPAPVIQPHSALPRVTAARLAATEYERFTTAIAELDPDEWALPTACPAWDIRAMVAHVVGMARMTASPLEIMRQQRTTTARIKPGTPRIDVLTAVQVERYAPLGPTGLVRMMERTGPAAARGRRWMSGIAGSRLRRAAIPVDGVPERWTVGFLVDTILTRDPWMHRSDLAEATGRPMHLTADHDGVIVADVVAEWAARHGRPYRLTLTGPAGGTWKCGDGEAIELDAVEFCRLLSGRGTAAGLLSSHVPF